MMIDTKNNNSNNDWLSALKDSRINSDMLMSGKKELTIIHNQEEYKLRLTGNGKLILTK
jgi:hemin uptake protein HemP